MREWKIGAKLLIYNNYYTEFSQNCKERYLRWYRFEAGWSKINLKFNKNQRRKPMELVFFIVSIILLLLISIFLKETRDDIRELMAFIRNGVPVRVKEGVKNDVYSPLYVQEINTQNVRVTNMPNATYPMQCEISGPMQCEISGAAVAGLRSGLDGIDVNFTNNSIDIGEVRGVVETTKYIPPMTYI